MQQFTRITRLNSTSLKPLYRLNRLFMRCNSQMVSRHYKRWSELNLPERQLFIKEFVKNYKKQFPKSRTNLSLKMLSLDMDKFEDSPAVFGIFYNDILKELAKEAGQTVVAELAANREENRFVHHTFKRLLVRKPTNIP
ncbi:hypothetical protein C6P45_005255 [Maudiozyma exigua]|uniref:Uncharacterized protein n=1 Tax=Maudiozyma exigua TaxID=34358 RepID=A0A9P6WBD7_MAUEX|nr:hypothetical protein C6P45_005255 [Kazachstania exigua]